MLFRCALLAAAAGVAVAAHAYLGGRTFLFFAGLAGTCVALGLVVWAGVRERQRWAPQLALAGLSALGAFVAVELGWAAVETWGPREPVGRDYTYDEARADRAAFRSWWRQHLQAWARLNPRLFAADPRGINPHVLIPGASLRRRESEIRVNRLGFRGGEIEREKGERFRVVVLGESTTFGFTVFADDRTWPEVLEAKISRVLACAAPVEVINGGVPAWSLVHQLRRLPVDVLPLEPDLVVTYHGMNGFAQLFGAVPGLAFADLAELRLRPSRVLERFERVLRLRALRLAQPGLSLDPGLDDEALIATPYGRTYLQLVESARAAGVEVALGSFNMAVDTRTPDEVLRFYQALASDVQSRVVANRLHTRTVRAVARRTDARFVDTSADLDGAYGAAYVDLVHFTQQGRDTLADNFLAGLRPLLRSHARLRCRPRVAGDGSREPPAAQRLGPRGRSTRTTQSRGS